MNQSIKQQQQQQQTRATVKKAYRSGVRTQNIRHLDFISFEKFLYSVADKCWSPI